jgi:hypothetical protein
MSLRVPDEVAEIVELRAGQDRISANAWVIKAIEQADFARRCAEHNEYMRTHPERQALAERWAAANEAAFADLAAAERGLGDG